MKTGRNFYKLNAVPLPEEDYNFDSPHRGGYITPLDLITNKRKLLHRKANACAFYNKARGQITYRVLYSRYYKEWEDYVIHIRHASDEKVRDILRNNLLVARRKRGFWSSATL